MKKSVFGFFLGLGLVSSAFSQSGLSFLKLGVGARSGALGHAMSSIVDDASAAYWNPARLTGLIRPQILLNHNDWLLDDTYEYAAFALPAFKGGLAASVMLTNIDGIEQRSSTPTAEPLGTVEANDLMFALSYGRTLQPGLSLGLTAKYLYQKIYVASATGYAIDIGLAYQFEKIVASGVVQNLGTMNALSDEKASLPATVRIGLSYELLTNSSWAVVAAVDFVKIKDFDERINSGAEFILNRRFALRAGYQAGADNRNISGGFGLTFSRYHLDYAFIPLQADFGSAHQFSVILDL